MFSNLYIQKNTLISRNYTKFQSKAASIKLSDTMISEMYVKIMSFITLAVRTLPLHGIKPHYTIVSFFMKKIFEMYTLVQ